MKYGIKYERDDGAWIRLVPLFDAKTKRDKALGERRCDMLRVYKPFRVRTLDDARRDGAARALRAAAEDDRETGESWVAEWLEERADAIENGEGGEYMVHGKRGERG